MAPPSTDLEEFERKYQILMEELQRSGMEYTVRNELHPVGNIRVEIDKTFPLSGERVFTTPFALYIGETEAPGDAWVCESDFSLRIGIAGW